MLRTRTSIVIAVFSTASGVGKTLVAINMAAELARSGYTAALIGLDLQFGNVCDYLQLSPRRTIADAQRAFMEDAASFRARDFLTEYYYGDAHFSVLAPPRQLDEAYNTDPQIVAAIISRMNTYDFIILDTTAIFSELNLTMLDISTIITFIAAPNFIPAIKNLKTGYETLRRFNYDEQKIRLVENRSGSDRFITTEDVEAVLGREFYHKLPNDYASAKASLQSGIPLVLAARQTALSRSLRELVARYTGKSALGTAEEEATGGGMFSWVRKIFS